MAADGLLAYTGDHLRDVYIRSLRAADCHCQRRIVSVQVLQACIAGLVSDHGELLEDYSLQGLFRIAARLALKLALLQLLD